MDPETLWVETPQVQPGRATPGGAGHPGPCPCLPGGLNPGSRRGARPGQWTPELPVDRPSGQRLPPAPQAKASPVLAARPPSLCGRDFFFLSLFFLLFICYNYRFTGSCKNGTERFPTPFIRFPLEVVPHITSGRCHGREPTWATASVCSPAPFYHAQFRVTAVAVKVQNCSIPTELSRRLTLQ